MTEYEFGFRGKTYRVVHRGKRWLVISGTAEASGPTLVDAMEAVFGPLHGRELTRIAIEVLERELNPLEILSIQPCHEGRRA